MEKIVPPPKGNCHARIIYYICLKLVDQIFDGLSLSFTATNPVQTTLYDHLLDALYHKRNTMKPIVKISFFDLLLVKTYNLEVSH